MATIKEIIPNYQDYLDRGTSVDELKHIAAYRQKNTKKTRTQLDLSKVAPPPKSSTREYLKTSSDVFPQITRGLATNFIRTTNLLKAATGLEVPKHKQLVQLGEQLNQTKEKISSKNVTPKRRVELDALQKQNQEAKGFTQNFVSGAKTIVDTVANPSEWTVQGATEFASDPTNAISFGVGKVVTKGILSPLLRTMAGAGAGAGENSIINSAIEYGNARGAGKSIEEAKKIAIQSAAGGAVAGSVLGGLGGAMPNAKSKTKAQAKTDMKGINNPTKLSEMDSAFAGLGEAGQSTNKFYDIVEAELQAHKDDAEIKQLTTELQTQGVVDPQIYKARIESAINVSEVDVAITKAINGDNPLPPSLSGARILTKIENTIAKKIASPELARTTEDVFTTLKEYGASDELASRGAEAYAKGDLGIFANWYSTKIQKSISDEAKAIKDIQKVSNDTKKIYKEGKLIDDVTNVKEDVTYQVMPKNDIKTNFTAGDGYQFRSDKQGNVIKDITQNFDSARHFGQDGGFDGLPVVDADGNVLVGNHRAEAIKNMSDVQFANYQAKMRESYPGAADGGMMVRVLKDKSRAKDIAKVSNDRRVKADSEKIILEGAKYKEKLKALPAKIESEVALKNHLGANDELNSNQALLSHLTSDRLPYAIDRYMKINPQDLSFKQMFYKNAYKLHNITSQAKKPGYEMLDITPLLDRSIDKITTSKKDKKSNLSDIIESYNEQLKSGGKDIEGNVISSKEFAADILGIALKHYKSLKDDGMVEFGKRIDSVMAYVKEQKTPSLFGGELKDPSLSDVALQFLNESDRNRLDIQDIKQRIESNENNHANNDGDNSRTTDTTTTNPSPRDANDGLSQRSDSSVSDSGSSYKPSDANLERSKSSGNVNDINQRSKSTKELGDSGKADESSNGIITGEKAKLDTKKVSKDIKEVSLQGLGEDITYNEAYAAHRGTSFSPEVRAKQRISGYVEMLSEDYADLQKYINDDEAKQSLLDVRFGEYRAKMKTLYKDLLAKESRTMSTMITGRGNFPVAANSKKMGYADNARAKFLDTREKWITRLNREFNPRDSGVIKSNDPDALGKLNNKLTNQIKSHNQMKAANKITRNKKLSPAQVETELIKIGMNKKLVEDLGKNGFESFYLTNSNAKIKNIKARIKEIELLNQREAEGKASTLLYDGWGVKENIPEKRLQITFDEKPNEAMRTLLKKSGYRWSPKNTAWQRVLTNNARYATKHLIKEIKALKLDKENC